MYAGLWERGPLLGKGAFGSVFLAKPTSKFCSFPSLMAVKSAEISVSATLQKEKQVFDNVQGYPFVIHCFGEDSTVEDNGDMVYNLLLEYASGGSLRDLIRNSGGCGLPESDVKRYTKCILKGLNHIHGCGYVHCDIKPENVLLVNVSASKTDGRDFYDVSLVDGFNLPISVTPHGGKEGCNTTSCRANVNTVCPLELDVKASDGSVIACKSACLAFNQPQYCCTGDFGSPDTCSPSNYSRIFKDQCPQAYSYAYDDKSSIFTCTGGADYAITFCP